MDIDDQQFIVIPQPTLEWLAGCELIERYAKASVAMAAVSSYRDLWFNRRRFEIDLADELVIRDQLGWCWYAVIDLVLKDLRAQLIEAMRKSNG